jgi:hypothetical protein
MSGGAGAPFMGMRPAKDVGLPTPGSFDPDHISEAAA